MPQIAIDIAAHRRWMALLAGASGDELAELGDGLDPVSVSSRRPTISRGRDDSVGALRAPAAVTVREATKADLPAILGLYAQPEIGDGSVVPLVQAREILARFKRYPDYRLYVAVDDGEIVGSLALLIRDKLGRALSRSGVVEDVVVEPARRGEDIGRRMLTFALERCRRCRCYQLAPSSNLTRKHAHDLYESLGFEKRRYRIASDLDKNDGGYAIPAVILPREREEQE